MAAHKIEIPADRVAEGKRLYERTLTPMRDIAAHMGICRRTLENRVREWGWQRRRIPTLPIDLHHAARGAVIAAMTSDAPPGEGTELVPMSDERRAAVAARIQDAVECTMDAVERVLKKIDPADGAEAERDGRTLAGVSRTLHELAAVSRPPEASTPDESNDDPVPRDVDEFRFELARRIRAFIEARQASAGRVLPEVRDRSGLTPSAPISSRSRSIISSRPSAPTAAKTGPPG